MLDDVIGLVMLVTGAALLAWLGTPAWRVGSGILWWSIAGLAAVLTVAISSVGALTIAGMVKQQARSAPIPDLTVAATAERVARGKAVADGFCSGCHSMTGTLTGGLDL